MTAQDTPPLDRRTAENSQDSQTNARKRSAKSTTLGGVAIAVLIAVYAVAQPVLNDRLGWQLPGIQQPAQDGGAVVAEKSEEKFEVNRNASSVDSVSEPPQVDAKPKLDTAKPKVGSGPLANVRSKGSANPTADASLIYGILSDQGNDRFMSPAGLMYGPGSQEGHRLKHLERHTVDDPGRPGSHGVFDGGMPGALAMIDKAYRKAKTGVQTSKQEEDGRIVFTVDMGSRVGYVGGIDGRRRKNPMARRVRLVLERNRVITAYPM